MNQQTAHQPLDPATSTPEDGIRPYANSAASVQPDGEIGSKAGIRDVLNPKQSTSPIDVVREIYAAMAAKSLRRLLELLAPDVVVTQDSRLPWGGSHVGHDGFAKFALQLVDSIDSSVAIDAIFEADGRIMQFGHTHGTALASGKPFDIAEVHQWLIRDGLAVEAHFAIDTPAMLTALTPDPT